MLEVLRAGIISSVQDRGRFNHRSSGIPLSGAMDQHALFIANGILGNDTHAAVVECCIQGPKIHFQKRCNIAFYGGETELRINGTKAQGGRVIPISEGDILDVGYLKACNYGYLAIEGGFLTTMVLGSRSYSAFVTENTKLKVGDQLDYKEIEQLHKLTSSVPPLSPNDKPIKSFKGPEYDQLSDDMKKILFQQEFIISNDISRIGFRMESFSGLKGYGITSSPIMPGTVQLTPSGNLIVMMRDCPVTGGYTRVLQLDEMEINRLAQSRVGSKVSFQLSLPT